NIQAQTNEFIKIIFNVISLLLIASILIAIIISGSITKSLKRLKCNMIEVSHGNLNSYYETSTNDEISIIGKVFNTMLMDIKNLIAEKDNAHELKRSAELKALQSQINPHFLYNTLDTIQWKALSHQAYDVVEMIQLLSKLFRLSLNNGNEFITIQEELEHVETYLKIQKIRYNQKINYTINCNLSKDKVCYI
ncbi:MAG: histidine kinase, partial [Christensenellaceae bacterium]